MLTEDSYAVALATVISALLIPVSISINAYVSFSDKLYEIALANATSMSTTDLTTQTDDSVSDSSNVSSILPFTTNNAANETQTDQIETINTFLRPTRVSVCNIFFSSFVSYGAFALIVSIFIALAVKMQAKRVSIYIGFILVWQALIGLVLMVNSLLAFADSVIEMPRVEHITGEQRFLLFLAGFLVNLIAFAAYIGCVVLQLPFVKRFRRAKYSFKTETQRPSQPVASETSVEIPPIKAKTKNVPVSRKAMTAQ